MSRRRKRQRLPQDPIAADIESLNHAGKGVAHVDGKATFIHGALTGEKISFLYTGKRKSHDEGDVLEVFQANPDRVTPRCSAFGRCGGCSLQHLEPAAQILAKQQVLLDALQRIGHVQPAEILTPITGESAWGYRKKARLGAKFVIKKDKMLVGFRERSSSFLVDMDECHVLDPKVGFALRDLADLIASLEISQQLPQIEVAMDDERCVLIFRVLEEPGEPDREKLRCFGETRDFHIYLQPGGPDTVYPLDVPVQLHYALPDFDLDLSFEATDFTQVNTDINRKMVSRTVELLDLTPQDHVLDLFCGIGNFTLPIARQAGSVVGVEGAAELVQRARSNAERNQLQNVTYYTANLYEQLDHEPWMKQAFNKVLLDPPRSGAFEMLEHIDRMSVERIVYVSCYPGTLARDAGELVNRYGYKLVSAGVMDMFPHTAHVESIALLEKDQ
jgi:23S rRNA (uracil1939-C5)-methyltransferase